MRGSNTNTRGGTFTDAEVLAVWRKGQSVQGYDSSKVRKDCCGKWISFAEYGKTSTYGWEVDHLRPVAKGGDDHINNLQPLHWTNNRHKADNWPNWTCAA